MLKITIEQNGEVTRSFEANALIGAAVGEEHPKLGTEMHQVLVGDGVSRMDMVKMVCGTLELVYEVMPDKDEADSIIHMALANTKLMNSKKKAE